MATNSGGKIKVWDVPVRLFHWTLAFLVIASYVLGQWGPSRMTLHFWSGYAIAALLAFRVIWTLPTGLLLAILLPTLTALILLFLPIVKGAVVGVLWALGAQPTP